MGISIFQVWWLKKGGLEGKWYEVFVCLFVLFFTSLFIHNMEPQTQKSNCVGGKRSITYKHISLKTTVRPAYRSCFSDDAYLCLSAQ